MEDNDYIKIVDKPPPTHKVFPTTFRFTTKADGRKRARMCFRGDLQEQYGDSYAAVLSKQSLKILLTDAALHDDELVLADISQAFCETCRPPTNKMFIHIPPGYRDRSGRDLTGKVFEVFVFLYGEKQAAHEFGKVMTSIFIDNLGFTNCEFDNQYFIKHLPNRTIAAGVYIDDNCIRCRKEDMEWLQQQFGSRLCKFTWSTNPTRIIGWNIYRDRTKLQIAANQADYLDKLKNRYGATPTSTINIPMSATFTFDIDPDQPSVVKSHPVQAIMGHLMHATQTRPDILYAVHALAQYTSKAQLKHYNAMQQVLYYLLQTQDYALVLGSGGDHYNDLVGYSEISFAADDHGRSRTGACLFYHGSLITAISKVQKLIAMSTAEAEYIGINELTRKLF
jgi:hypothetical protein